MKSNTTIITIFSILLPVALGCGKAAYEDQMKVQANELAFGSRFIDNLQTQPMEVLDQIAEIRLPTFVNEDAKRLMMSDKNRFGEKRNPDRIQPPGMRIPGFRFSYEQFINLGGRNEEPVYWYFAAADAKTSAKALEQQLKRDVAKTVPKSRASFTDVQLDTPKRGKLFCRKISAKGSQLFNTDPDRPADQKMNGQFDLYLHTTPSHHIIIGVRGTDKAIAETKAIEMAGYAVGTLNVLNNPNDEGDA